MTKLMDGSRNITEIHIAKILISYLNLVIHMAAHKVAIRGWAKLGLQLWVRETQSLLLYYYLFIIVLFICIIIIIISYPYLWFIF